MLQGLAIFVWLCFCGSTATAQFVSNEGGLNFAYSCANASGTTLLPVRLFNGFNRLCSFTAIFSPTTLLLGNYPDVNVTLQARSWTDIVVPINVSAMLAAAPVALHVTASTSSVGCTVNPARSSFDIAFTSSTRAMDGTLCTWAKNSGTTVAVIVQETVWVEYFAEDIPLVLERSGLTLSDLLPDVRIDGAAWVAAAQVQPALSTTRTGGTSTGGSSLFSPGTFAPPGPDVAGYGLRLAASIFQLYANVPPPPHALAVQAGGGAGAHDALSSTVLTGAASPWLSPLGTLPAWQYSVSYPSLSSLPLGLATMRSVLRRPLPTPFNGVGSAVQTQAQARSSSSGLGLNSTWGGNAGGPGVAVAFVGALLPNTTSPRIHPASFLVRAYSSAVRMGDIPPPQYMVQQAAEARAEGRIVTGNGTDAVLLGDTTFRAFHPSLGVLARCIPWTVLPSVAAVDGTVVLASTEVTVQRLSSSSDFLGAVGVSVAFRYLTPQSLASKELRQSQIHANATPFYWSTEAIPLYWGSRDFGARNLKIGYHSSPWSAYPTGILTSTAAAASSSIDRLCGELYLSAARGTVYDARAEPQRSLPGLEEWGASVRLCLVRNGAAKVDVEKTGEIAALYGSQCVIPPTLPSPSPSPQPGLGTWDQVVANTTAGMRVLLGMQVSRVTVGTRARSAFVLPGQALPPTLVEWDKSVSGDGEGMLANVLLNISAKSLGWNLTDQDAVVRSVLDVAATSPFVNSKSRHRWAVATDAASDVVVSADLWVRSGASMGQACRGRPKIVSVLPGSACFAVTSLILHQDSGATGPDGAAYHVCMTGVKYNVMGRSLRHSLANADDWHNLTLSPGAGGAVLLPKGSLRPGYVYCVVANLMNAVVELVGSVQQTSLLTRSVVPVPAQALTVVTYLYVNLPPTWSGKVEARLADLLPAVSAVGGNWSALEETASGGLVVAPSQGTALTTQFGLAVTGWVDGEESNDGVSSYWTGHSTARTGAQPALLDSHARVGGINGSVSDCSEARVGTLRPLLVSLLVTHALSRPPRDAELTGLLRKVGGTGDAVLGVDAAAALTLATSLCVLDHPEAKEWWADHDASVLAAGASDTACSPASLERTSQSLALLAILLAQSSCLHIPASIKILQPQPGLPSLTIVFRAEMRNTTDSAQLVDCSGVRDAQCASNLAVELSQPILWVGSPLGPSLSVSENETLEEAITAFLPSLPSSAFQCTVLAYVTDADGGVAAAAVRVTVAPFFKPTEGGAGTGAQALQAANAVQGLVSSLLSTNLSAANPYTLVAAVGGISTLLEPSNATGADAAAAATVRTAVRKGLLDLLSAAVDRLDILGGDEPDLIDDSTASSIAGSLARITGAPAEISVSAALSSLETTAALMSQCSSGMPGDAAPPLPSEVGTGALATVVNVLSAEVLANNASGSMGNSKESLYKSGAEAAVAALTFALMRDVPEAGSDSRYSPSTSVIRSLQANAPPGTPADPATGCPPGLAVTAARVPVDMGAGTSTASSVSVAATAASCGSLPSAGAPSVSIPLSAIAAHPQLRRILQDGGNSGRAMASLDVRITSWAGSPVSQSGASANWKGMGLAAANASKTRSARRLAVTSGGRISDLRPTSGLDTGVLSISLAGPASASGRRRRGRDRRLADLPVSDLAEPIVFTIPLRTTSAGDVAKEAAAYRVRRFSISCPASNAAAGSALGSRVPAIAWAQPNGADAAVTTSVAAEEFARKGELGAFDTTGIVTAYKNVSYWSPQYPDSRPGPAAVLPRLPGQRAPRVHNATKAPLRYVPVTVRTLIVTVECGGPVGQQVVACGGVDASLNPAPATVLFVCPVPTVVPTCAFWDAASEAWSSDGCMVRSASATAIVCACDHLTDFGGRFSALAQQQQDVFAANALLSDLLVLSKYPHVFIMVGSVAGLVLALMFIVVVFDAWGDHQYYKSMLGDDEVGVVRLFEEAVGRPFVLDRALDARYRALLDQHKGTLVGRLGADTGVSLAGTGSGTGEDAVRSVRGTGGRGGVLTRLDSSGISAALHAAAAPGSEPEPEGLEGYFAHVSEGAAALFAKVIGRPHRTVLSSSQQGRTAAAAAALDEIAHSNVKREGNPFAKAVYMRLSTAFDGYKLSLERMSRLTGHTLVPHESYAQYLMAVHEGRVAPPPLVHVQGSTAPSVVSDGSSLDGRGHNSNLLAMIDAEVFESVGQGRGEPALATAQSEVGDSEGRFVVANPMLDAHSSSATLCPSLFLREGKAPAKRFPTRTKPLSSMSDEERKAYYSSQAQVAGAHLDDTSPWCCIRAWHLRKLIIFTWWTLVYTDNEYTSVCTRHDVRMNRAKRLALLATALVTSMFASAFWYAFRGEEEEASGEGGTDGAVSGGGGGSGSGGARKLLTRIAARIGANVIRRVLTPAHRALETGSVATIGTDDDYAGVASATDPTDVVLPEDSPELNPDDVPDEPAVLPPMDTLELLVVAALATAMQIPIQYCADVLFETAGNVEFAWRYPALQEELSRRKNVQGKLSRKGKHALQSEVLGLHLQMEQLDEEQRRRGALSHAQAAGHGAMGAADAARHAALASFASFSAKSHASLTLPNETLHSAKSFLSRAAEKGLLSHTAVARAAAARATLFSAIAEDAGDAEVEGDAEDGGDSLQGPVEEQDRTRAPSALARPRTGRSSHSPSQIASREPPFHPAEGLRYGWIDPPQPCLLYCRPLLWACGRLPSQRAEYIAEARAADREALALESRLAMLDAQVKLKLAAAKAKRKATWQSARKKLKANALKLGSSGLQGGKKKDKGGVIGSTEGAVASAVAAFPAAGVFARQHAHSDADGGKGGDAAVSAPDGLHIREHEDAGEEEEEEDSRGEGEDVDGEEDEGEEYEGAGGEEEAKESTGFIQEMIEAGDIGERLVALAQRIFSFIVDVLSGTCGGSDDDFSRMSDDEVRESMVRSMVAAELKAKRRAKRAVAAAAAAAARARHERLRQACCPCSSSPASREDALGRSDPYHRTDASEAAAGQRGRKQARPTAYACCVSCCGATCVWTRPALLAYAAVSAWGGFCLYYVLLWGLTQPAETTQDFAMSWVLSLGYSILIIQPSLVLLLVFLSLAVWPIAIPYVLWIPCCTTSCARTARALAARDGSSSLTGRLENLTLVRAAGAASALTPETAVVAFGASAAVSAVYATLVAISGGRRPDARLAAESATSIANARFGGAGKGVPAPDRAGVPFADPFMADAEEDVDMGSHEERARLILTRYSHGRMLTAERARRRIEKHRRTAAALNKQLDAMGVPPAIITAACADGVAASHVRAAGAHVDVPPHPGFRVVDVATGRAVYAYMASVHSGSVPAAGTHTFSVDQWTGQGPGLSNSVRPIELPRPGCTTGTSRTAARAESDTDVAATAAAAETESGTSASLGHTPAPSDVQVFVVPEPGASVRRAGPSRFAAVAHAAVLGSRVAAAAAASTRRRAVAESESEEEEK